MSQSEFQLRVQAADPSAEIFIIDRTFAIRAHGVQSVQATLPRDLYKVRLQLGATTEEAHLVLDGQASRLIDPSPRVSFDADSGTVGLQFRELDFASPIPLRGTSRPHDDHFNNAARVSARATCKIGTGGSLFVFSRASSQVTEPGWVSGWNALTDLALHDAEGRHICYLSSISEGARSRDPWAGCNLELNPGSYRLRRAGANVLEMPLFIPAGWQLQVFLMASPGARSSAPLIDFSRPAVLLSRRPFHHEDRAWRVTEQARQGLAMRRSVVRVEDLREMSFVSLDTPMLGIYGAHLLLMEGKKAEIELVRDIVRNLRTLVGPHPDVEALALGCNLPVEQSKVLMWPPMLAASWQLIVQGTASHPELVPSDSLAAWVASRLWTSGGPWLSWTPVDDLFPSQPDRLFQDKLSPPEARLWRYLRAQASPQSHAKPTKVRVSTKAVVRDLSLPSSVVSDAAISLARRLTHIEIPNASFRDRYAANAIGLMTNGRIEVAESDEALLARAQRGEFDAFGSVVRRYQPSVLAFVQGIVGDGDDPEDVTQEVFARAFETVGRVPGGAKLSTWLYGLSREVAIGILRGKRGAKLSGGLVGQPEIGPAEMMDTLTATQAFEEALRRLSTKQRSVFILQMHEMSTAEIALIVEESQSQVHRELRTAAATMRRHLAHLEPTSSVSAMHLRELAMESLQRASLYQPDLSARVVARLRRISGRNDKDAATDAEPAVAGAMELAGKVILEARHSAYAGPSKPWRSMGSRFVGRRVPDDSERKRSPSGGGRLVVENELEEDVYYVTVEENFLDLPFESTGGQIIYVSIVGGRDGPVAGFGLDYRGPFHTMGFAAKFEDRSLLFTFVLDNDIKRIRCPQLAPSDASDGIQFLEIPPVAAKYSLDVDFNDE